MPWLRRIAEIPKALRRGPSGIADLARAVAELAYANRRVARDSTAALPLVVRKVGRKDGALYSDADSLDDRQHAIVDRVTYAIPVMAMRVPWRADCLVQALAAHRWLAREEIPSAVALGAARDEDGGFLAHAWLRVGERIVTGGDVSRYHEFDANAANSAAQGGAP